MTYTMHAGATPSTGRWRVAEFWSSANPGRKVLMLAKDESDLTSWADRSDFVRWVSPIAVQTEDGTYVFQLES